jgi:hypothetical protein
MTGGCPYFSLRNIHHRARWVVIVKSSAWDSLGKLEQRAAEMMDRTRQPTTHDGYIDLGTHHEV